MSLPDPIPLFVVVPPGEGLVYGEIRSVLGVVISGHVVYRWLREGAQFAAPGWWAETKTQALVIEQKAREALINELIDKRNELLEDLKKLRRAKGTIVEQSNHPWLKEI